MAALILVSPVIAARAQQTALNSHEVNPDQSLTIRYYAPTATEVAVSLDYDLRTVPLKKDASGVWSLTTGPLQSAVHTYGLRVDGVPVLDPLNRLAEPGLIFLSNQVRVQGPEAELWDDQGAPHGVVHHHVYRTAAIKGLPKDTEDYYVYTPPGYDAARPGAYPVLYLLHGWGSLADSSIVSGQANLILDNLIGQGRVVPMVIVMPQAYGDFGIITLGFDAWKHDDVIGSNVKRFSNGLLTEIIPQVEKAYHVAGDPAQRAIAGISMGGSESLLIGLGHPEVFSWVGGFSAGVEYSSFDGLIPALDSPAYKRPTLVWEACGTEDDLIGANRRFVSWLRTKGIEPTAIETPGIHNWPVWRDNLVHFLPLLFRPSPPA